MRKAFRVLALALALSISAYGGETQNGAPVPPPLASTQPTTTDGDMPNMGPGAITEAVLSMLASVLGVL